MDNASNTDTLAISAESSQTGAPKKTKAKAAKPLKVKAPKTKPTVPKPSDVPAGDEVPDLSAVSAQPEPDTLAAPAKKTMEQITNNLYREAAERIVALMDAGNSIWQKPWVAPPGHSRPFSASSGLQFSGFNRFPLGRVPDFRNAQAANSCSSVTVKTLSRSNTFTVWPLCSPRPFNNCFNS